MTDTPTVYDMQLVKLALGDYAPIRFEYVMSLTGTIQEYLYDPKANNLRYTTRYKNLIKEYFPQAFEMGYTDGGGELPTEPDDSAWIADRTGAEQGFASLLFQQLKQLKKLAETEGQGILEGEAEARAEGYARTLDTIYSEGKIRGAKNRMLTFGGEDGDESCPTCQRLKGERHRASWWVSKGLIPGQRGNNHFECGGWQCQHILFDDNGNLFNV